MDLLIVISILLCVSKISHGKRSFLSGAESSITIYFLDSDSENKLDTKISPFSSNLSLVSPGQPLSIAGMPTPIREFEGNLPIYNQGSTAPFVC
jgi:hypothetical protein